MADTTTTAYGLTKPEIGASEDTWGEKINTDLDTLDTVVNAIGGKTAAGTLSYANSAKLATTATGIDVTGTVTMDGGSTSADFTFGDNDKAIFGAGSDLQIYHDGSASYVSDVGTGDLNVKGANVQIRASNNDTMAFFAENGEVKLFYDGSTKLATTSTGVDITGTLTSDGLTVGGDVSLTGDITSSTTMDIGPNAFGAGVNLKRGNGAVNGLSLTSGGDISFYEDTGTTPKFFWDASAESLGIGTSSPADLVQTSTSANTAKGIRVTNTNSGASTYASIYFGGATSETDSIIAGLGDSTTAYGGARSMVLGTNQATPVALITSGTERMRIDSSGNVGIGTSSPTTTLTLDSGGTPTTLKIDSLTESSIDFDDKGGSAKRYKIGTNISSNDGQFEFKDMTANAERMRIDSSGNVGIGTSSPGQTLHLYDSGATNTYMQVQAGTKNGYIGQQDNGEMRLVTAGGSTFMTFQTEAAERMRIDSSGNLLVGKTSDDINVAGHQFLSGNAAAFTRAGGVVSYMTRNSSDGEILRFRKDTTTVGSIGSANSGVNLFIAGTTTGLKITNDNTVSPASTTGSNSDADTDLGASANRFKDLYLSGGVYLGGTGAANKLDDYEEGTWTPTLAGTSGNPTVTYSKQQGRYTKIGRTVYCEFDIQITAKSGGSGGARINGLPFTKSNDNPQYGGDLGMIRGGRSDALDSTHRQTVFTGTVLANTTEFELAYTSSIGAAVSYSVTSDIGTGRIVGTFQYIAS